MSDSSIASSVASSSAARKRGRPPTTGDYVGLAEAKRLLLEQKQREREMETEDNVFDPRVEATSAATLRKEAQERERIRKDVRVRPTHDLGVEVVQRLDVVRKIATSSGNLKGTYVRALKEAAMVVGAAASELAMRVGSSGDTAQLEEEIKFLRCQLAALRRKLPVNEAELASTASPPPPPQPVSKPARDVCSRAELAPPPPAREPSPERAKLPAPKATKVPKRAKKAPAAHLPERAAAPTPPGPSRTSEEQWVTVTGRTARRRAVKPTASSPSRPPPVGRSGGGTAVRGGARKKAEGAKASTASKPARVSGKEAKPAVKKPKGTRKVRVPTTAAVTVTVPEGAKASYAQAMRRARTYISLEDIGIDALRLKKAVNGGLILQVPGSDAASKAAVLEGRLRDVLSPLGVKVARPTKTAEMRVLGLDPSVSPVEMSNAIAKAGGCLYDEVSVGEIRETASGLGTVWIRAPAAAVRKIAQTGRLKVGEWISVRVEVLAGRKLQCFRCLEFGHTRSQCGGPVDRSNRCYRCGAEGHKAQACEARAVKCPLCADLGRPADHRMGGSKCSPPRRKGRGRATPKDGAGVAPEGDPPMEVETSEAALTASDSFV